MGLKDFFFSIKPDSRFYGYLSKLEFKKCIHSFCWSVNYHYSFILSIKPFISIQTKENNFLINTLPRNDILYFVIAPYEEFLQKTIEPQNSLEWKGHLKAI